ncbi:hypothetical protein FOL46_009340 [Perkinsus olseni]|uniref:Phosphatidylserine synthase 2 n=1 Tax=Perkinsus olseni TaxID=32597 RepID=A0A7J6ML67_PEROL|nr:hypothetical protein FOL46_009340 [Perkinsus olseni]
MHGPLRRRGAPNDIAERGICHTTDGEPGANQQGAAAEQGKRGIPVYTPLQTSVGSAAFKQPSPATVPDLSPDGKSRRVFDAPVNCSLHRAFLDNRRYELLVRNSADTFRSNLEFIERPRQVVFAALLVSVVVYVSHRSSLDTFNATDSARAAVAMVFLTVMIYSVLQTRDGLMVRPHPAIWRAIHGAVLVYMIILVILLVVPPRLGIQAVHMIFPEIHGGPAAVLSKIIDAEPASHDSLISFDHLQCSLTKDHILGSITNIWFAAHVVGYWAKMCIFRDWSMCWTYSFAFEFAELGLVWLIPEFQECWWDSLLLDVFGANFIGMCIGRLTLYCLECRAYVWNPSDPENSPKYGRRLGRKFKRAMLQFTPYSWSRYDWPLDASHWILSQIAWLQCFVLELNSFFLIHAFALRPSHIFSPARQLVLAFHGAQAVPEWYEYIKGHTKRIGHNVWLLSCITTLESIVCLRYGKATHPFLTDHTAPPRGDLLAWVVFSCITLLWLALYLSLYKARPLTELPLWLKCLRIMAEPSIPEKPDATANSGGGPVSDQRATYKRAEYIHNVVTPIVDLVVETCFHRQKTLMSSEDEREREKVNKPEFKLELIEECIHTLCDEYGIADDQRPKPMGVTDADVAAVREEIAAIQKQIDDVNEMRESKRKPKHQQKDPAVAPQD